MHQISDATRRFLDQPAKFLIGGEWRLGSDGQESDSIDPATGQVIGSYCVASDDDADAAVEAAHEAFTDKRWRGKTPSERQAILLKLAELMERDAQVLAELETLDGGKLYGAALNGEIPHAAETFRYYAGWVTKLGGHLFEPSVPGRQYHAFTRDDPVGVAALITPWNGALVSAAWKLAPALAAGCSCVLKPSEMTSLSSLYFGRLLAEAGIPDGVVNIVTGPGSQIGSRLVRNARVAKVSFTGSTATGKAIINDSRDNITRLSLELGGKSPVLIFDDADLDTAIPAAAEAIFSNAGQVCVAGSRIYAQSGVYDRVVEGLVKIAEDFRIGSGLDPASTMGPLIGAAHQQRVSGMVEQAKADGAQAATGGSSCEGAGSFYRPTVLIGAAQATEVVQEEVFGPVVAVSPFGDEAEGLRLANDSRYGLAASIWTGDGARALRLTEDIQAGIIWINEHGIPELAMPIGGVKNSGIGREHGLEGLRAFTETRSVMMRLK